MTFFALSLLLCVVDCSYEFVKQKIGGNKEGHHPLLTAISGGCATMAHDSIVSPMDTVKQRMQVIFSI
jgi:solute carrier family 25 iron transporter 28/37